MFAAMHAADEIGEHRFGDFKIADDTVLERTDGGDGAGSFSEHFLGDQSDGVSVLQDSVGSFFYGDDGGFIEDDAFAFDADQRIAGAKVDAHVFAEHAQQPIKDHLILLNKKPGMQPENGASAPTGLKDGSPIHRVNCHQVQ